jgi:hypothetical protein
LRKAFPGNVSGAVAVSWSSELAFHSDVFGLGHEGITHEKKWSYRYGTSSGTEITFDLNSHNSHLGECLILLDEVV